MHGQKVMIGAVPLCDEPDRMRVVHLVVIARQARDRRRPCCESDEKYARQSDVDRSQKLKQRTPDDWHRCSEHSPATGLSVIWADFDFAAAKSPTAVSCEESGP